MPLPWREWITHDWKVLGEIDRHGRIHSAEVWNHRLHYVPSPFTVKRQPDGRWWREENEETDSCTATA